jgi:hypothetical protein
MSGKTTTLLHLVPWLREFLSTHKEQAKLIIDRACSGGNVDEAYQAIFNSVQEGREMLVWIR